VPFNYGNTVWNEVVEVHGNNVDTFSDGQDSISGGPLADTLWGDGDNDKLFGYGGADIMYGGYGGADTLEGGNGNDLMYGGDGGYGGIDEVEPDVLYGQGDNDTLYGEAGSDWLDPGPGADFAYGGLGNDTFRNSLDNTGDLLDGGGGTDDAGDYDGTGMDTLLNFP